MWTNQVYTILQDEPSEPATCWQLLSLFLQSEARSIWMKRRRYSRQTNLSSTSHTHNLYIWMKIRHDCCLLLFLSFEKRARFRHWDARQDIHLWLHEERSARRNHLFGTDAVETSGPEPLPPGLVEDRRSVSRSCVPVADRTITFRAWPVTQFLVSSRLP